MHTLREDGFMHLTSHSNWANLTTRPLTVFSPELRLSASVPLVYTSDDGGETWEHCFDYPFLHARPFVAGRSLDVLGEREDLMMIRSDDGGEMEGQVDIRTTNSARPGEVR